MSLHDVDHIYRYALLPQDVLSRRDNVRGYLSMEQTETFLFISEAPLATAKRPRVAIKGSTTAGNCISEMRLPTWKDACETWQMSFADKKELYGDARVLPGQRPDCDTDLAGTGAQRVTHVRKDEDIEPVSYNAIHKYVWEEVMHQVGSKGRLRAVIDLTPTDTTLAMVAMESRTPYVGVGFNTTHVDQCRKRLTHLVFQRFLNTQSVFCNPDLALMMSTGGQTPTANNEPPATKKTGQHQ